MKKVTIELPDSAEALTIVSIGRVKTGHKELLNVSNSTFDLSQGTKIRCDNDVKWIQEKDGE